MMGRRRVRRNGFTLFELMISIVITGCVAVGTLRLLLTGAQVSRNAGAIGYRTAALAAQVSRITAAPPGSLADGTATVTVTAQPFPYTVTTVTTTSGTSQTVTITITPTGAKAIGPVTRTISRTIVLPDAFGT